MKFIKKKKESQKISDYLYFYFMLDLNQQKQIEQQKLSIEINLKYMKRNSKKIQFKSLQHLQLKQQIESLNKFNKQLKQRIASLQDAIHEVYISKKKYKIKYKQTKQKLQILQLIKSKQHPCHLEHNNQSQNRIELDENYLTHKVKRFNNVKQCNNQEDIVSLTLPTTHSNVRQQNQSQQDSNEKLSKYLVQNKNLVAGKIMRSNKKVKSKQIQKSNEIIQIKETLLDVKNQLQKFIFQLDKSSKFTTQKDKQYYTQKSMQQRLLQICQRLQRIQNGQKYQIQLKTSALKSKSSSGKSKIKSGSFLKTIEDIGRDLTEWKIGYI